MLINEVIKSFLRQPEDLKDKESSVVHPDNVIKDLSSEDLYPNTGIFFDDTAYGLLGTSNISDIISKQKEKIMKYRQLAMLPDVTEALDEIVNEIIFSVDDEIPIKIEVNEENKKLIQAITDKFNKILKLTNIRRNLFQVVKNSYVDGQIIMHLAYDKKNTKNGIRSIKMIEPCLLYYDKNKKSYRYLQDDKTMLSLTDFPNTDNTSFDLEELVREDFGLYNNNINLSYLEYAVKPANMLNTLEDLLIPLRFSRSISRRVFNVDIGDLPNKRGAEVMREHQTKFKYKKFYNNQTGEVTNQQHITSMVEDYWFSNRSGGKGTSVDVLDETGNLGELNDILYFSKKLYRAMKVPSNRIGNNPDGDKDFSWDETRVTKEDLKFFMFISRIRQVYSSLFKEILKREVVSTGVMTQQEWDDKENDIKIYFTNENSFIQKMKVDTFMSQLDIYSTASEQQGKLFSVNTLLKTIFRYSDDEIEEEFKKIKAEEGTELYSNFYKKDEEGDW